MLVPEDLLAAKILNRQRPDLKEALFGCLEGIQQGRQGQLGLLGSLLGAGAITRDEAMWVHQRVEHHKRTRALAFYGQLAEQAGVSGQSVRAAIAEVGDTAAPGDLGRALVEGGLITVDQHRTFSFQARQLFDRELASQVEAYRGTRVEQEAVEQAGSLTSVVELPSVASGVFRLDPSVRMVESAAPLPAAAPPTVAAPPRFDIPDWVDTADERLGQVVNGYRILGRIGRGAMGIVYLVDHPDEPDRPTALKLLLSDKLTDADRGRFKREILANSLFSHQGILEIYDAGDTDDGTPFLAMEFFNGEDMAEILEAQQRFEPKRALNLAIEMYSALAAAHDAGVVHRDIKPENVLVSLDGDQTKLMDYGIAILPGLDEVAEVEGQLFKTMVGGDEPANVPGTPMYMSPEQAYGETNLTPATDIYSMGLVLYEMLAGRLPFESETAQGFMSCHMIEDPVPLVEVCPDLASLPQDLHDLLERSFSKSPTKRPESAAVVVETLRKVLAQLEGGGASDLDAFDGSVDLLDPFAGQAAPELPGVNPADFEQQPAAAENPGSAEAAPGSEAEEKKGWLWGLFGKRRG